MALENFNNKKISELGCCQIPQFITTSVVSVLFPSAWETQSLLEHDSSLTLRNALIYPFLSLCLLVFFPTLVTRRDSCQIQFVWFQVCHVFVKVRCLVCVSFLPFTLGPVARYRLLSALAPGSHRGFLADIYSPLSISCKLTVV